MRRWHAYTQTALAAAISATVALVAAPNVAVAAADPHSQVRLPRVDAPETALLNRRLEAVNLIRATTSPMPAAERDTTIDTLNREHVRTKPDAQKRLTKRTIVVCQRSGDPWRNRLDRYLKRMFGDEVPIEVLEASEIASYPASATVVAFSDTGSINLPCVERDPRFSTFLSSTQRPRKVFGRPVLCPSSVGTEGNRVQWYFADMNFAGRTCETARFGELLGLPRWARDPSRLGNAMPAIRAYLHSIYGMPDPSAHSPEAGRDPDSY